MAHWRLYYHVVWATKARAPLLTPPCRELVERSIRSTARNEKTIVHAVGMVTDHVHVVASIPPSLAVGDVVGKMKGAATRLLNTAGPYAADASFGWQRDYGVYSVSERALEKVCDYVNNQEQHHDGGTMIRGLEVTESL